jgi:hypothetical protein
VNDLAMHHLPSWADVDANLQVCATSRSHDLALQPPGDTCFVEDLHAIGGPIDVQMKALATPFTFNIQEKAVPYCRRAWCLSTAEQASKESAHDDLQRSCQLAGSLGEVY